MYRCHSIAQLIDHLTDQHSVNAEIITKTFSNFDTFISWKNEEEKETNSQFTLQCAPRTTLNTKVWYYYCHRAGKYISKGQQKRQLKSQGTNKLGKQCTAHMKVSQSVITGDVSVSYCGHHHNHSTSLAHLQIPNDIRLQFIHKLQQGITMDRILDDIRESLDNGIGREHLVTKQDLHNIKARYNIEGSMRHQNDLTSVTSWVHEMQSQPYNPIIIFKQQGNEQSDDIDNVAVTDFLLGIQTEFQRDILVKFSETICMDTTHGTNMYDFKLLTIAVIDEYGEGVPVGWMLSNREDSMIIIEFLNSLKKRTGPINSKWIMTDDAPQFYNAWIAVFGNNKTQKLLCAWHVDRSWRNALRDNIQSKSSQMEVYHQLRTLLQETEESHFRVLLQEFLSFLKDNHKKFYTYFNNTYCTRIDQWGSFNRSECNVNTNMFLEAFHRVLKVVYLNHKQNRRIDTLLTTLLKISRDKAFERFKKIEFGKSTHRVCEINKRHRTAEEMLANSALESIAIGDKKWQVISQSTPSLTYIIQAHKQECDCQLRCAVCNICVHYFSCTCLDAVLHSTICKHAHFVVLRNTGRQLHQLKPHPPQSEVEYFNKVLAPVTVQKDIVTAKQRFETELSELSVLVSESNDLNAIKTALKQLKAVRATVLASQNTPTVPLQRKRQYAPNTSHETQDKYHSTKKKRSKQSLTLSKPSRQQIEQSVLKLHQQNTRVCGVCFKEEDKSLFASTISWIECTKCSLWIHFSCTKLAAKQSTDIPQDFQCQFCTNTSTF